MAEDVSQNVIRIRTGSSNVYLFKNGNSSILIDAGNKGNAGKILKQVRMAGLKERDIGHIVVTHCHYDHVGSLYELKKRTGAEVIVHEKEEEALRKGYLELPDGTNPYSRFMVSLGRKWLSSIGAFKPVKPDIVISQRHFLDLGGAQCTLLATPGHTEGSISCIIEDQLAFVGDAAFNVFTYRVFPPFANDINQLLNSWRELLKWNIRFYYPGHGKRFTKKQLLKSFHTHLQKL